MLSKYSEDVLSISCSDKILFDNEVLKSKKKIENLLNNKCEIFSFPFGSFDDFTSDQINLLRSYDYRLIFTNIQGSNLSINNDLIKRIIVDKTNNLKSLFF